MDEGALTVPNFLRTYSPNLVGGSLGHHLVEVYMIVQITTLSVSYLLLQLCYGIFCLPWQYKPEQDVFNAAQSGAMITDLVTHEFDYLLEQLKKVELSIVIASTC